MLDFLKSKKTEIVPLQEVDEKKQEIATVQVRDIKQYLVDEYDRAKKLEERNNYLRHELDLAEELKLKYDASLVLLDEYKARLESYEKKFSEKDKEIEKYQENFRKAKEEVNDYKITLSRTALTKDEIKAEVVSEIKADIIRRIQNHKGNLSKASAIELVKEE